MSDIDTPYHLVHHTLPGQWPLQRSKIETRGDAEAMVADIQQQGGYAEYLGRFIDTEDGLSELAEYGDEYPDQEQPQP